MKLKGLGWLVLVGFAGCGLGATLADSANSSDTLNGGTSGTDAGKGTAGGGGGPSTCQLSCEAEQVAYKNRAPTVGSSCEVALDKLKGCVAALRPPLPEPCEAEGFALKQCVVTTPGPGCDVLAKSFEQCLGRQPPHDPGFGCKPPPPPHCGGGEKDKCEQILVAYKECQIKDPNAKCDGLLRQLDECQAGQKSPPPP